MRNPAPKYEHVQVGHLMIVVLGIVSAYFLGFIVMADLMPGIVFLLFLIMLLIASFTWLKVTIDNEYIRVIFGYGLVRKRFVLKDVVSASTVRNRWYYGWGVRVWFWPYMWIYNVSGFDAVEIRMRNGKRIRIGTDEPQKLQHAIMSTLNELN